MVLLFVISAAGTPFAAEDSVELEKRIEAFVPCKAITQGPKSHWFSYYDKLQFDPSGRYVLGMEVGFDDRAPKDSDAITLGMVDLQNENQWIPFGQSRAWGWQQGCMLQWLPGSSDTVIYNDRQGGRFVCVVQNVFTSESRILPRPVYAVAPNGTMGVSVNFARLNDTRPGYGYTGLKDAAAGKNHPDDDGIFLVNLKTGQSKLIFTLDFIVSFKGDSTMENTKHWINHLLFNPDGSRFIFLHRWVRKLNGRKSRYTRMLTAAPNGSGLHVVADHEMVSHFIWRDPTHILAWSNEPETGRNFHLYEDRSDRISVIGKDLLTRDGHCTYSPDRKWMLTDTYPDKNRMQTLMLIRLSDSKIVKLGRFYLSKRFTGQTRCDLHPRWSRDGNTICIDSLHSGQRQMYLLDVSGIVK